MTPHGPVVLGAQMTQASEHAERGIPRYVSEHVRALGHVAPELIARIDLDPERRLPGSLGAWQTAVPIAYQTEPDGREHARAYHVMSPFEFLRIDRLWPRWAQSPDVKLIVTLYDLIPLLYPEYYLQDPAFRQSYLARLDLIRTADAVLAISQATADDAVDHLGIDRSKIHVIHAGCSRFFGPPTRPLPALLHELRQTLPTIGEGFVFCTAGIDPRKNIEGLITAYSELPAPIRRSRQLVITCRMNPDDEVRLRALAATMAVDDRLILTGHVSDQVLRLLYQACGLFVFPSFYEGFGLPVIEAMRCGAPVVASNTSSLPALVTDAEARFDPASPADMRNVMLRAWSDRSFLARLRDHSENVRDQYTWEDTAALTANAYRQVLAVPARTIRRARLHRERWALFSPMPPQATGIADYTDRLATGLAATCDVDVFVDGQPSDLSAPSHPHVRVLASSEFGLRRKIDRYDHVLHCLGNSQFHQHAWRALMQFGGDVLLHEIQLTNLYTAMQASGAVPEGTFAETLLRQYGNRLPNEIAQHLPQLRGLSSDYAEGSGIFMAAAVLRRAERVLVHSETARHLALLEASDRRDHVHVVPFLCPPVAATPLADDPIVIATFGIVAETKGASLIASTFALLADILPDSAQFAFVGQLHPATRDILTRQIDSLGIAHRVELTGRLDEHEYASRLRQATVAVQLRVTTHGEMSAAVADCLSAGVPTIVSDLGALSELPSDVVMKVSPTIDDRTLAWAIADLVADRARRTSLAAGARAYAAQHQAAHVARSIQQLLRGTSAQPAVTPDRPVLAKATTLPAGPTVSRVVSPRVARATGQEDQSRSPVIHAVSLPGSVKFLICVDPGAFDPISLGCATGTLADPLIDLMLSIIKPGDRVLDIGGHVGSFSLAAAAAGCDVLAFEASAENAALIRESARINGFTRLTVIEAAASDEPGHLSFWSLGPWGHVGTIDMPSRNTVPAVRVDDVLAELGWSTVNFVKMDVEGHELPVLRGMEALLSKEHAPPLLYEANGHTLARSNRDPRDLIGAIERFGYESFSAGEHHLIPVTARDLQPALMADYIALKSRRTIPAWPVVAPYTKDEIIARAVEESSHPSEENRRYIAAAIASSDLPFRQRPAVARVLARLAEDRISSVRAAAIRNQRASA